MTLRAALHVVVGSHEVAETRAIVNAEKFDIEETRGVPYPFRPNLRR
jgi:hypothetical protein